jgi:hypothetical protein
MPTDTLLEPPPQAPAEGEPLVTLSGLDPAAASLGRMVGLLRDRTDGSFTLDPAWFENPVEKTSSGVKDDPAKVADLLAQLLGEVGGRALGVPVKDPALLGTWYPIQNPKTQLPTGLYVVSYADGKRQVFGLGAFHRWRLPADAPALTVNAWGLVPVVRVGAEGVQPVLNLAGYPITVGIAAEGPEGKDAEPLVDTHGFRFNGVKVSAALDVAAAADPVRLALTVLQLQLPGDAAPADRSLADLAAIPGTQIIDTASSLFLAALAQLSAEAEARAAYLLPVLGLASAVPKSETRLPLLRWDRLFALAAGKEDNGKDEPKDVTAPFRAWFQEVTADPALVRAWLGAVAGLLGATGVKVTGDGTRAHPFSVPAADLTGARVGVLSFTLASVVDPAGARRLYPGLAFQAVPRAVGSAELRLRAELEAAEFVLTDGTPPAAVPTLRFDAGMRLVSAAAGEPLADFEGYRFGALEAGVSLGLGSALVPAFQLVDVATPDSAFERLDLLSPGELAVAGGVALEAALRKLLGLADDTVPFASNVAALLGVINPRVAAGATWPKELAAPLTRERIGETFKDPLGAISGWYQRVLTTSTPVDGKTAFTYVLQELAGLLANAQHTVHPEVLGEGTAADPWRATLSVGDGTLPAALTGFRVAAAPGVTRLVLGVELAPVLQLAGTKVVPSLTAHFLSLDLPDAGTAGRVTGVWGRDAQARIDLPDGFTTPAIATAKLEVKRASLSASWSRVDGWHWSLFAGQPALWIGDTKVPLGGDLDFSDAASFRELVTTGEKAFAPLLTGVLGVALLRTRTRAGTAAAGVLGLLPEIDGAPVYPKELAWPASMPRVALTGLADPRPAIRAQLAAVLSSSDTALPALGLLGWVLNPSRADAPKVEGGGTADSPWRIPIAGSGFEGLAWYGHGDAKALGLGVGRSDVFHFGAEGAADRLRVTVSTRLAAAEVSLATGALLADEHAPALAFTATVGRASGALAELPGGAASVGRVVFGLALRLDRGDGSAAPSIVLSPMVTLEEVVLPGGETRERVTLDELRSPEFAGAREQAFVSLVDAALQAAVAQAGVADAPGFRTAYALLTALGLTLEKAEDEGRYGINPAGWQALLANATGFARDRLGTLLTDVKLRAELFRFVREQLHLPLPDVPRPAAVVLEALGLVGPEAEGWPLRPEALLELARNPFATLSARFERLATDADARQALVTALVGEIDECIGPVRLRVRAGTQVSFELDPAKALDVAGVLRLSGTVSFSLTDLTLSAGLRLFNPTLGLSLVPALTVRVAGGAADAAFTARVEWGDGTRPAAEPLTLVPFERQRFVDELAALAPPYVLNVLVGAVVEARLLERYPLARQLFEGLGIAKEENGHWTVPTVLGLLRDPRGWLLSNGILGKDGRFDLGTFGALLRQLPEVRAENGVGVERTATGARVVGLPYGFRVEMGSTAAQASLGLSTGGFAIAGGRGKVEELGLTVTLGADWQPGVKGRLTLATGEGFTTTPYYVTAGYDGAFLLQVGERPPGVDPPPPLVLLPFQGWGALAEQGARRVAPALLRELTPRLLRALHARGGGADTLATKLETVGGKLQADRLLAALAATTPFTLEEIEKTALRWLLERFSREHAADTALAVAAVFEGLVSGVDTDGGLVRYRPSEKLPLTLLVGVDEVDGTRLLGAWADVRVPVPVVRVSVKRTGVGIPIPDALPGSLARLAAPVFSFGASVRVPVDGEIGPELVLSYDQTRVVLAFDPLGGGGAASALSRELLPEFFPRHAGDDADRWKRLEAWLLRVSADVLPRYVSSVVLNTPRVKGWLEAPLVAGEPDAPKPADVLKATSLVISRDVEGTQRYYLNALGELQKLTPEAFLGNFLRALLKTRLTLLRFGADGKGKIVVGPSPNDPGRFGILVAAPDLAIPKVENVVLQLGGADAEWIEQAGGDVGALEPGISLYVPVVDEGGGLRPRFQELELNLVNVGLDVKGKGKAPLVDLGRFQLGAVKPRALVTLRMKEWKPTLAFGAGVTLSGIGISLAPNALAGTGGTNPIARNLLGSGSAPKADNPPTNPTFSVSAAYAGKLWVRLHGDGPDPTRVVLPVQRSFGPLYVGSIGLGWKDADRRLEVLFSGRVALAGLNAEVLGLAVGIPVTRPTDLSAYTAELQGLDLSFRGGPVEIGGALLKQDNPLAYTGMVLLKASKFSLVGLGSYALVPTGSGTNAPSLFLFAALRAPLGGHPAFFVTGVAAGLAFNRNLKLPAIGEVHEFPLVKGVVDGSFTEGQEPGSALEKLAAVAKPEIGQYWLAAGLTFTTFKLLDSAALLFLRFGREWEVALIGLSRASLPPEVPRNLALAYIELAFKVSIRPAEGVVTAEAQLTPNSYVITRECKLTGGFAFYLWFADVPAKGYTIRAGDFVVTLGGYHPAFTPPAHYPAVPRLGFSWLMNAGGGTVSVAGGAYFALVPTAVMAGGYLRVTFQAGPLRAWLEAYANFLVEWRPFYYEASIGVGVGVAFQTEVLGVTITLKVELGADLELAGPPTHGRARVHWWVVSFTIPFGEQKTATDDRNLTWGAFEQAFLPTPVAPKPRFAAAAETRTEAAADPYPRAGQQVVKLAAAAGLLRQEPEWVVRPVAFALRVETAVPTPEATVTGWDAKLTGAKVGVRPMGVTAEMNVPLTVAVKGPDGAPVELEKRGVMVEGVYAGAPAALWSLAPLDRTQVPDPAKMVVARALVGVVLRADRYLIGGGVGPFPLSNLEYAEGKRIDLPLDHTPTFPPAPRYPDADQKVAFRRIRESVMAPGVVVAREAAFATLRAGGIAAPANPDLSVMAAAADLLFTARPVLARIGVYQPAAPPRAAAVATLAAAPPPRRLAPAPRMPAEASAEAELQGIRRRYAQPAPAFAWPAPERAMLSVADDAESTLHPPAAGATSERWTDAAALPGRSRAMPLAGAGVTLYDGTLALWKVDPGARLVLRHAGELPATATCFDAHGEIVARVEVARGEASPLPAGTGQVAVHGGEAGSGAVGWERETALTKANPAYALGDGFALRTQNLNRVRRLSRTLARGTVDAARLLDDNRVVDVAGVRDGWVETVFFQPYPVFAVVVDSPAGDAEAAVRVSARRSARPGETGGEALRPTAALPRGGATVLVFSAPAPAEGEDVSFLSILVEPMEPGVRVLGAWGIDPPAPRAAGEPGAMELAADASDGDTAHAAAAESAWRASRAAAPALSLDALAPPRARVSVVAVDD